MKKYNRIIFSLCLFAAFPGLVHASSLDELYRDIVRSDNQGYLPMFVKNRNIPDVLIEEEVLKKIPATPDGETTKPAPDPIKLTNDRAAREAALKAIQRRWDDALKAVQENRVTPVELAEITARAQQNEPKAVEILAWMNARGVGVKANLIEAFNLYQKAAALKVPNAAENALLVYKSMNARQRELLNGFKN